MLAMPPRRIHGRLLREEVPRIKSLVPSPWSGWFVALVPEARGNDSDKYKKRSKGHEGLILRKIEDRFRRQEYDNGIYELCLSRGENQYVVYVGRSRSREPYSINERIRDYCRDGSHISDLIDKAMQNGYTMAVRAKSIPDEEDVEEGERKYLDEYDYAWNDINNGERRENVLPP